MKRTLHLFAITILACISVAAYGQQYKTNGDLMNSQGVQVAMSDKNRPATLNGEKIYSHALMAMAPVFPAKDTTLRFYILTRLKPDLAALPDGMYGLKLTDIVIDKTGRIVYSRYGGLESTGRHKAVIPDDMQVQIESRLHEILSTAPQMVPARRNKVNVPFIYSSLPPATGIEVKNHVVRVF